MGRSRGFLLAVSLGGLLGVIFTFTVWAQQVMSDSYFEYGMHRLIFYALVRLWNPLVLSCAGAAVLLYIACILLLRWARWPLTRVVWSAAVLIVAVIAFLGFDWGLRALSGFGMSGMVSRAAAKVTGLVSGDLELNQLRQSLAAYQKGAFLLVAGLIAAAPVFLLMSKLPWEKLMAWTVARSRHIARVGLVLAGLTLLLNASHAYDTWRNLPSGPNIVIIVIDCLRDDRVGYSGYSRAGSPNIDHLARTGVVFQNAYSNAPWTKPSVAALFTSLYPNVHTAISYVGVLPAGALTLAEVMKNNGYFTILLNSENPILTRRLGFHQGFDVAEDTGTKRNAALLTDSFLSFLPDLKGRKFFAYLHYMDLHLPYSENEFSRKIADSLGLDMHYLSTMGAAVLRKRTVAGDMPEESREHIRALYDGQLRYVDIHLGRLFDRLDAEGFGEETLIIFTADHGEEFWEHGNVEHGHTLYEELLHVPLVLSWGELQSRTVSQRVSLLDLMPTILDLSELGHEDLMLQGESLRPLVEDRSQQRPRCPVYAVGTLYGCEKYCVIRGDDKLILNTDDDTWKLGLEGLGSTTEYEVYCLRDDPLEQSDLGALEPVTFSELSDLIHEFTRLGGRKKAKNTNIDEELERKLRSVGYL